MTNSKNTKLILTILLILVGLVVYSNISEQLAVDQSKLPDKVENSKGFQKWITNLKNKDMDIEADDFRLDEENEVYNTQRMWVYSIEESKVKEDFDRTIEEHKKFDDVVYSPSKRQFIDYRHEVRGDPLVREFEINDARYYGLRDSKLIDSRILTCSIRANCYFDRAYFLSNDVFVISEVSRNIDRDDDAPKCSINETCTYTFKVNVIDLINNSNLVYESKPIDLILADAIPNF